LCERSINTKRYKYAPWLKLAAFYSIKQISRGSRKKNTTSHSNPSNKRAERTDVFWFDRLPRRFDKLISHTLWNRQRKHFEILDTRYQINPATLGNVVDLPSATVIQPSRNAGNNYVNYKLHGTVIIMERFSKGARTTEPQKQLQSILTPVQPWGGKLKAALAVSVLNDFQSSHWYWYWPLTAGHLSF